MKTAYKLLIVCATLLVQVNTNAQILKKLKNKIDNTVDKKIDKKIDETSPNSGLKDYCEDKELLKTYQVIYKGTDNTRIFYDESSISMNSNGDSYRIIFKEGSGKSAIYTVIEDGKTLYTGNTLPESWVKKSKQQWDKDRLSKYIVIDSSKTTFAGSKETTIKTAKIDEDKLKQGAELSKQTAEYKAMSPEEKSEYDDFIKNELPQTVKEYNNSGMADKTYTNPGVQSFSVNYANTSLVVKGKNQLKKGDILNDFYVSEDEKDMFIYGMEASGKSFLQVNDKRTYLETPKDDYNMSSQLLVSKDGKKACVVSILSIPENNVENVYVNYAPTNALITSSEGTKKIKVNLENYMLSNDGKIISANQKSGEVFIDGTSMGTFNKMNNNPLEVNSLLVAGSSPNKIGRYNQNGSIDFMDGKTKQLGALFPVLKTDNGKSMLYWFTECDSTIYLAHTEI